MGFYRCFIGLVYKSTAFLGEKQILYRYCSSFYIVLRRQFEQKIVILQCKT